MKTATPHTHGPLRIPSEYDHEDFMHLLIKQQAGKATRTEKAFIKNTMKASSLARELYAEVNEASRLENWTTPPRKRFPLFIAAGVALLLITGAGYFFLVSTEAVPPSWKTLEAHKGATNTIKLADGTEIRLNAATTLRYPATFAPNRREVYVEGEAFFNVTADPQRPFIVHTALADIQVLGTSFNVRTYDSCFRAALVTGGIAVSTHEGEKIKLRPGYAASLDGHTPQLLVASYDKDTVLTWLSGTYRFENTPLKEVCRMAERVYNVTILVDDEALVHICYSGIIRKKQPIQALLEDLAYTSSIDYHFDKAGSIHIGRKK